MIKLHYALIGRGYKGFINIGRTMVQLEKPMRGIYIGKTNYVIGADEETCLAQIRHLVKKKYEGIKIIRVEELQ